MATQNWKILQCPGAGFFPRREVSEPWQHDSRACNTWRGVRTPRIERLERRPVTGGLLDNLDSHGQPLFKKLQPNLEILIKKCSSGNRSPFLALAYIISKGLPPLPANELCPSPSPKACLHRKQNKLGDLGKMSFHSKSIFQISEDGHCCAWHSKIQEWLKNAFEVHILE